MEELRQISSPDYHMFDFRLSSIQPEGNYIIYHPSYSILNYSVLDLVKKRTASSKGYACHRAIVDVAHTDLLMYRCTLLCFLYSLLFSLSVMF